MPREQNRAGHELKRSSMNGQGSGFFMIAAMLGKKIGMTRVFDPEGASVSVTLVQAGPCTVLQVAHPGT